MERRTDDATEIFISTDRALVLAVLSLGWNIYRDLVSKYARVKSHGARYAVSGDTRTKKSDPEELPEYIVITAVKSWA